MSAVRPDPRANDHSARRVYVVLAASAVVLTGALLGILQFHQYLARRYIPLQRAERIELELTSAHLWLEELLTGDSTTSIEEVRRHLDRAALQADDMLGGQNGQTVVVDDVLLQDKIRQLGQQLGEFRQATERRWQSRLTNPEGAAEDDRFDAQFRSLLSLAAEIKTRSGANIRQDSGRFDALRAAIVASIIALVSFVALTFRHYIRYRRQVEAALRESEEKYRGLYESSNDAVMLLDENGFLDCNDSTLHVFRVPDKQAFCGLRPQDLSPPQQPNGRDSAELADEQIKAAIRDGSNRFEWMHRRADGQLFPAEVLLSRAHFEGRPVLQAVVRDATDRKRAEELLRANEEKLRTISDAALDAVIMMDAAGRAVHWNPAAHRMFGYSAEEILGQDIHQLLTPERYREEAGAALRGFLLNGQGRAVGQTLELQALRRNGEEFPVEISLAPIRVEGHWNAVAVVRDITARKQVEQAVRDEQRSLRRLLRSHDQERKLIAYEIHDGLAQQLVAALYQCQAAEHSVHGASKEADATLRDLNQSLRQSLAETRRLISGVRPPVLDEFGVVTAVQTLIEDNQMRGGPHIDFQHQIQSERLEPILENTIFRIIQEGLANACSHSGGQHVRVELTETERHVELSVQDDGHGFDPEIQDHTRYGLAGIRERTRLLGGRVTLQTEVGQGTLLAVQLPKDVGDLADSV
jgi:PAS domain S-box-containing protein